MRALTYFTAYGIALDEMHQAERVRAKGRLGIHVDQDTAALRYQRRERQAGKFRRVARLTLAFDAGQAVRQHFARPVQTFGKVVR